MKKSYLYIIALALSLLISSQAFCQVSIIVTPPAFQFSFADLWNVQVIGVGQNTNTYRLVIDLKNDKGVGFSVKTKDFQIPISGLVLTSGDYNSITPLEYQFSENRFSYYTLQQSEYFPPGTYSVRYSLLKTSGGLGNEPLDEARFEINIPDLSDLFLTSPYDGDTIQEFLPLLTWVYSNPFQKVTCDYEVSLVHKPDGQEKWEAINSNPNHMKKSGVPFTLYQYAASDRQLQEGETYAWYVEAMCNGSEQARSQVWQFTIAKPEYIPTEYADPNAYYELFRSPKGSYIELPENFLKIRYKSRGGDQDSQLNYQIIDVNGKVVVDQNSHPLEVSAGENRYKIDLCPFEGVNLPKGQYTFQVTDDKGVKWNIRFGYQRRKPCE